MPPTLLYSACVGSALGLYLLMRGTRGGVRGLGTIIALAAFAWLLAGIFRNIEGAVGATILPIVFGVIATMAAVRVITHRRPVFAALYFILVVLASSGLFLVLQAEFMAFALIIVYAGAILITYMFVLMLAQQSPSDGTDSGASWYDRTPREPAIALLAGFILLVTLIDAMSDSRADHFDNRVEAIAQRAEATPWNDLARMPRALLSAAQSVEPETVDVLGAPHVHDGVASVPVRLRGGVESEVVLPPSAAPGNTRVVGLALVADFPVSLEMAGVILLMAMFGAVVLARKQIELGEDEARESAGMAPSHSREPEQ